MHYTLSKASLPVTRQALSRKTRLKFLLTTWTDSSLVRDLAEQDSILKCKVDQTAALL